MNKSLLGNVDALGFRHLLLGKFVLYTYTYVYLPTICCCGRRFLLCIFPFSILKGKTTSSPCETIVMQNTRERAEAEFKGKASSSRSKKYYLGETFNNILVPKIKSLKAYLPSMYLHKVEKILP